MDSEKYYFDTESNEIMSEQHIRSICFNAGVFDLECNQGDIMDKSTNLDIILNNIRKSVNGTIEEVIQYANDELGYSIIVKNK